MPTDRVDDPRPTPAQVCLYELDAALFARAHARVKLRFLFERDAKRAAEVAVWLDGASPDW